MDLKRFTEITGREALERLSNGLSVFEKNGTEVSINLETNEFKFVLRNGYTQIGDGNGMPVTVVAVLESPWYIKKPFDVRAEMLARPNEWVGAFKDHYGEWAKVGFDSYEMTATKTFIANTVKKAQKSQHKVLGASTDILDKCIPIEDVLKEDLL